MKPMHIRWASESRTCTDSFIGRLNKACEGYLQPKNHTLCEPGRNSGHCLNNEEE